MACSGTTALAHALSNVLTMAKPHLPIELEQQARRTLELYGPAGSSQGACKGFRQISPICDV